MGIKTPRFIPASIAIILGYAAAAAIMWFVVDPADPTETTKLAAFGGCFVVAATGIYLSVTRLSSVLRKRGYPVSRAVNAAYAVATAGLLFGVGATAAYAPLNRVLRGGPLVVATFVAGALAVAIGAVVLDGKGVWDSLAG